MFTFCPTLKMVAWVSPVVLSSDLTILYKCFDFSFPFPFPVFPYAPYIVVIPKSYPSL